MSRVESGTNAGAASGYGAKTQSAVVVFLMKVSNPDHISSDFARHT